MRRILMVVGLAALLSVTGGVSFAAEDDGPIFGSQLMTRQERIEYRSKLRAADSDAERERIRKEHHERMKERAKERGITLSEEPPAHGAGMGSGSGMGPGGGRGR